MLFMAICFLFAQKVVNLQAYYTDEGSYDNRRCKSYHKK